MVTWVVCMFACPFIASEKGRDATAGFLLGFFLGPLGLFIEGCLPSLVERKLLEQMLAHLAEMNPQQQARLAAEQERKQREQQAQAAREAAAALAAAQKAEQEQQARAQREEAERQLRERTIEQTRREALACIDDLVRRARHALAQRQSREAEVEQLCGILDQCFDKLAEFDKQYQVNLTQAMAEAFNRHPEFQRLNVTLETAPKGLLEGLIKVH